MLQNAKEMGGDAVVTKSGLMTGLGESKEELLEARRFLSMFSVGDPVTVIIDGQEKEMSVMEPLQLQDFSYGRDYGPAEVRAQIRASRDAVRHHSVQPDARQQQREQSCLHELGLLVGSVNVQNSIVTLDIDGGRHGILVVSNTDVCKRNQVAEFPLNGVIACWTEGVQKMKVGGKSINCRLLFFSNLAFTEIECKDQKQGTKYFW